MRMISEDEMKNPLVAAKVAELRRVMAGMNDAQLAELGIAVGVALLLNPLDQMAMIGVEFLTEEMGRRPAFQDPQTDHRGTYQIPDTIN